MSRVFAIIPAAGHSRRMGQPKLLLPWGDGLIIDAVLSAWTQSKVDHVVVVTRGSDVALQTACARWPVTVTSPDADPPDMKASIQHGIRWLQSNLTPTPSNDEHWMVAPADLPTLRSPVINRVMSSRDPSKITVPRFEDHESHPVCLPWALSKATLELNSAVGLKAIVESAPKRYVDFASDEYSADVDTMLDYEIQTSQQKLGE